MSKEIHNIIKDVNPQLNQVIYLGKVYPETEYMQQIKRYHINYENELPDEFIPRMKTYLRNVEEWEMDRNRIHAYIRAVLNESYSIADVKALLLPELFNLLSKFREEGICDLSDKAINEFNKKYATYIALTKERLFINLIQEN